MDPTQPPPIDPSMAMAPMGPPVDPAMMMPPEPTYDVKIKRCIKSGQVKVKVLPPEDFLIDPNTTVIDEEEGLFFADLTVMTRSEAKLKWPDKEDIIDSVSIYTTASDNGMEKQARESRRWRFRETKTDKATEKIQVMEAYLKVDYDGDGVAEWRQVCKVDSPDSDGILSNEEWGGEVPYVSITPQPMPHRYRGRSIYDDVAQIQRIKTVLLRQALDNLYLHNNPMLAVNSQAVENKDALANPEVGQLILANGDPNAVVAPIAIPFTADKVLPTLEYWDQALEKRTGVSRSTMALDVDALQHQTATAVNAQQSAAFTKVEAYARNIAECGGFKRLFHILLRLFVENQKSVKHIKLRDNFIKMDPRGWNADMNVTVNVGLGAGSRDRDLGMLQGIMAKQELAIQALQDPFNPLLNIGHWLETARKGAEVAGLKSPEQFFPEITQEQVQQFAQMKAQNPTPTEEDKKIQGQVQIETMKLQAEQQRDQNRAVLDEKQAQQKAAIEQLQAQADIATAERQAQADIETNRFKVEAELQLAREKAVMEMQMRREEHAFKMQEMQSQAEMKMAEHQLQAQQQSENHAMAKEQRGEDFKMRQREQKFKLASDTIKSRSKPIKEGEQAPDTSKELAQLLQEILQDDGANKQRDGRFEQALGAIAQAMQQLAAANSAPTEIVRDPKTGRAIGAQKRLN